MDSMQLLLKIYKDRHLIYAGNQKATLYCSRTFKIKK